MLEIRDPAYLEQVREFAKSTGQLTDLEAKLEYLDTYACRTEDGTTDRTLTKCVLSRDFAPNSFEFVMYRRAAATGEYAHWLVGGLVYHSAADRIGSGSAPALATTLVSTSGWTIHT